MAAFLQWEFEADHSPPLNVKVNLFHMSVKYICDSAQIGHPHSNPHVPQCKRCKHMMPSTATSAPADAGLNLHDIG